jgi:formamidopyrimidine-DNA glycosylase
MPELPEVETVRTGLEMAIKGACIQSVQLRRKDLRIPFPEQFEKRVSGRTIRAINRRAKYLLFDLGDTPGSFQDPGVTAQGAARSVGAATDSRGRSIPQSFACEGGVVMLSHLGMSGCFSVAAKRPASFDAHDHVVMQLGDGRWLIYNDPRRFGLITLLSPDERKTHPLLAHLGPEPLDKSFTPAYLARQLEKRGTPVKVAIMDQELVVGVGNIYASEALFLCGIHPNTPGKSAASAAKPLVAAIRRVLKSAIASGGSSLRDFVQVSGEAGYFQHHFNVYGREGKPCFSCDTPIRSLRMGGRSTFYCPACQI